MTVSAATMTLVRAGAESPEPTATPAPSPAVAKPAAPAGAPAKTEEIAQKTVEALAGGKPAPTEGEPAKEEAAEGEKPAEEKKDEPKEGTRFAILARKEQQLVKDRQQLGTERQAFESEKLNFQAAQVRREEEEKLWQSDPLAVLEKRGWSYEKLTNLVLNEKKPTPEMIAREEAKRVLDEEKQKKDEAEKKRLDEQKADAQRKYDEKVQEVTKECTDHLETNAEKFELCTLYKDDAVQIALATIEQHFQETRKQGKARILSYDEAYDLVEKYFEAEAEKALKTKKLAAKAQPQPKGEEKQPATEKKETTPPAGDPAKPRTPLNNRWAPSSTPKSALTWEERLERARRV